MVYEPSRVEFDKNLFQKKDWGTIGLDPKHEGKNLPVQSFVRFSNGFPAKSFGIWLNHTNQFGNQLPIANFCLTSLTRTNCIKNKTILHWPPFLYFWSIPFVAYVIILIQASQSIQYPDDNWCDSSLTFNLCTSTNNKALFNITFECLEPLSPASPVCEKYSTSEVKLHFLRSSKKRIVLMDSYPNLQITGGYIIAWLVKAHQLTTLTSTHSYFVLYSSKSNRFSQYFMNYPP